MDTMNPEQFVAVISKLRHNVHDKLSQARVRRQAASAVRSLEDKFGESKVIDRRFARTSTIANHMERDYRALFSDVLNSVLMWSIGLESLTEREFRARKNLATAIRVEVSAQLLGAMVRGIQERKKLRRSNADEGDVQSAGVATPVSRVSSLKMLGDFAPSVLSSQGPSRVTTASLPGAKDDEGRLMEVNLPPDNSVPKTSTSQVSDPFAASALSDFLASGVSKGTPRKSSPPAWDKEHPSDSATLNLGLLTPKPPSATMNSVTILPSTPDSNDGSDGISALPSNGDTPENKPTEAKAKPSPIRRLHPQHSWIG